MMKRTIVKYSIFFAGILVFSCSTGPGANDSLGGAGDGSGRTEAAATDTDVPAKAGLFGLPSRGIPPEARFDSLPLAVLPGDVPGIGALTTARGDAVSALGSAEGAALSRAFRSAYHEALYRGLPLLGVLSGDRVHHWVGADPTTVVQNWRTAEAGANSWRLPGLLPAVGDTASDRVFLIGGAFLDAYGRGEGLGGANGPEGYGVPLSDAWTHPEGTAQRFSKGLLVADAAGKSRFLPGPPPSSSVEVPEGVGLAAGDSVPMDLFRSSWLSAVDRGLAPASADGPVLSVSVGRDTLYFQSYGSGSWGLAAPGEGTAIPRRAFILEGPAMAAFIGKFDDVGLPVTDPYPHADGTAQRFAKGLLIYKGE